jgi:hypothetical protein
LVSPILGALAAEGYTASTPIQFHTIPPVLGDAICAASQKPEPVRPPLSRYLQRLTAAKQTNRAANVPRAASHPEAVPPPLDSLRSLSAYSEERVTC